MTTVKQRILMVDDDVDFVEATKDLLESRGHEVAYAHNGKDGIALARTFRPDVMLLDVMMTTDTEGFDVSRQMQEIPELKGIPIILMTGIKKAMSLPFSFEPDDDWLPVKAVLDKPVAPEKLLSTITSIAGGK